MTGVDWQHLNLPAIWSLMAADDLCNAANRPLDWDALAGTVGDQKKRLETAAEALKDVWSPDANASARVYQQYVSQLTASMGETLEAAQNTTAGLNGVVTALSSAQSELQTMKAGRDGVSHDAMPRFIDHAEDKYDKAAQQLMLRTEAAVADHATQIQAPPLYQMNVGNTDDGGQSFNNGSGGSSGAHSLKAQPIPISKPSGSSVDYPVTPGDHGSAGADSGASGSSGSSAGPVLSGVVPQTLPPGGSPGSLATPGIIGGVQPTAPTGGAVNPSTFGVAPIGGNGLTPGTGGFGVPAGRATSGSRARVSIRRGLPSGAVIGEDSERGLGGGRPNTNESSMLNTGTMGGRGKARDEDTVAGEADQQWATRQGVAPVIAPDDKPVRHDPGPGVIGYHK